MANPKSFLPHEVMMESFRKDKRIHRETLSLKAITLDYRLQAREKSLDIDNVKSLHSVVKDGLVLAPITVFRIKGVDYVANGFHRVEVHRKEGLAGILADVILDATWQEAVEFSACCNLANHALSPTRDDKKKAVFMLMANGWLQREDSVISDHTRVGVATVAKYRIEYCDANKIACPSVVHRSDGKKKTLVCPKDLRGFQAERRGGETKYVAVNGDKKIVLGSSREEAAERLGQLRSQKQFRCEAVSPSMIRTTMECYGIRWEQSRLSIMSGIEIGIANGWVVYVMRGIESGKRFDRRLVASAIGSLIAFGVEENMEDASKAILTPDRFAFAYLYADVFSRYGIKCMALDEFLDQVGVKEVACEGAV